MFLTKAADRLADETGLGRAFVGSILLAGATSLPELMVDLNAVWLNHPDLAVGDLLGSSLFNMLILAVMDTVFRHPRRAFTSEFGHHAQASVLSINLTAFVGIGIMSQMSLSIAGVGVFSWVVAFAYLVGLRLTYSHRDESPPFSDATGIPTRRWALARPLMIFVASTGVITVASPYLVRAADQLAEITGLGHTFVGTTVVALSTSLPEMVATLTAFRIGAPDLALANIFGSNTFNMVLLFPLDVFYPATLLGSVRPVHALTALCVIAVSSVAVLGQMSRKREKVRLWEPSSELIIVLTVGFLYLLYAMKGS